MMSDPSRIDQWAERFTRGVIRWRWPVVLLSVVLTGLAGSGARGLFFDTNYRAFFSDENPQLTAFEALQNIYTKNDNLLFVVAPADGEAFTSATLTAVEELVEEAWQLPYALRVDAVTNFQHTVAEEDDLIVEDLVEGADELPASVLEAARAVAIADPVLARRLVNEEATVTGVNVTLQFPGDDAFEVTETMGAAREVAAAIQAEHPGLEIYITGIAALNNAFMEVSQAELARLMPFMFLAMFLVMIVALRSFSGTVATLTVLTFSVAVAMGVGGFWSVGLTPPSAQAPIIIMTLAIADSIHILVTILKEMQGGRSKYDAIVESIRINLSPVFLTTVSTIIGFLSLNFSDVPPFNHLGNMTAVGVTAAFLLSITFLPALMAILPVRARAKVERPNDAFDRLGDFVVGNRRVLLWGTSLAVLAAGAFIPANELDDRFVEYFDERIDFRTATDFTTQNLTGVYQIEFSLSGGESGSISEPGYLRSVENFAAWYRDQAGVNHVATYTDVMKRLNRNMHGDDDAYYRLPENRELAAQYLLLYEMSLPYGLDLNNQINVDKSATRFTVTTNDLSTTEIRALTEKGEAWLATNAPDVQGGVGSGPMVMFAYISGINIRSMLLGSTVALLLISGLMVFALRNVRLGLISFIPNLVPAAVAFGIWGMTTGVVNIGLSVVIGMTLGIVVDDSVHFLTKYLRARREKGLEPEGAVRYAFSNVGRAITVTTAVLVIGFLILSTSAFDMNASMGKMTAITLLIALAADFLLLPPLLMALDGKAVGRVMPAAVPVPVAGD
jgi:predicted RND superfamily exporter protein